MIAEINKQTGGRDSGFFGGRLAVGGDRRNFQEAQTRETKTVELASGEPWDRGSLGGELLWKSWGEPGDGKQDWSWWAGTSEEPTAGK